ncbi:VOC family protein [Winogradskya consettensis]|uniref:Glyoxalase n=1 Tax=Winogradskya consettensis TaxID=113560 RepID=A0A919SZZ5_9ACTN|nr:VOC family protein [Actinoplanes consettensis]GIM80148.1 glyoxalase [Actinoplanes consettensis]
MNFVSIRVITGDVTRLVDFYERATGLTAEWSTPEFAEVRVGSATIAIAGTATLALFAPDFAAPAANRSVITEFLVDDVDAVFAGLADSDPDVVQAPTTMPWGNRSLLIRDPDGNLVNFFTPVTAAAKVKFAR